jgi:hypothetical protein
VRLCFPGGVCTLRLPRNLCPAGTLPPSWGSLTKLKKCWVFNNTLNGTLPDAWSGMAALEDVGLNRNNLTGGGRVTQIGEGGLCAGRVCVEAGKNVGSQATTTAMSATASSQAMGSAVHAIALARCVVQACQQITEVGQTQSLARLLSCYLFVSSMVAALGGVYNKQRGQALTSRRVCAA